MNTAPDGTRDILAMREALLDALPRRQELRLVDDDFVHLLRSWFNRGFLELHRIDWRTPALVLEKIIEYEAVHQVLDWEDLRRRLQADRRCFGFFHPSLPDEPLIFVGDRAVRRAGRLDHGSALRSGGAGCGRGYRRLLLHQQLPAGTRRDLLRRFPHQAGGAGARRRDPEARDLRHPVAGPRLPQVADPGGAGGAAALLRRTVGTRSSTGSKLPTGWRTGRPGST